MLRVVLLISILIYPFKTFAICNSDDTFDATATVEIPKPKNFFLVHLNLHQKPLRTAYQLQNKKYSKSTLASVLPRDQN